MLIIIITQFWQKSETKVRSQKIVNQHDEDEDSLEDRVDEGEDEKIMMIIMTTMMKMKDSNLKGIAFISFNLIDQSNN